MQPGPPSVQSVSSRQIAVENSQPFNSMPEPPPEASSVTHDDRLAGTDYARGARPAAGLFEAACESHVDFVWRFAACRGVGSPAAIEHVVHKVFGVLHGRLISLEDPSELRVSLASITRNVVRGYLRQQGDHTAIEPLSPNASTLFPLADLAGKTAGELCNLILGKMSETQREVFLLCEMEGFTLFESAEALHIGESTLRTRLEDACRIFNVAVAELRAQRFWQARDAPKP